jgi:hypothetical protein
MENNIDNKVAKKVINDEKKIDFNMKVSEFDVTQAHLDSAEDLDAKTIGAIEKQIRGSYEYRSYVNYLKNELDLTRCALMPGMDTKVVPVSLEFHHFPFTLYDVTEIIGRSMLSDDNAVSTLDISEKVMEEHFRNNIGLVPLTLTLHEMAHNGAIAIPFSSINGNYKAFMEKYDAFITKDQVDRITILQQYNASDEAKDMNKRKLEKRIANYNIEYINPDDQEDF